MWASDINYRCSQLMRLNIIPATLLLSNSFLLAIWVLRDTIALRNILLWFGSTLSIYYITQNWRYFKLQNLKDSFCYRVPLLFLFTLFFWITFHLLFLSTDWAQQYKEFRSTWLRAFLALIMGSVCGLIVSRSPKMIMWVTLGLLSNFIGLLIEYIPLAIAQKKMSGVVVPVLNNYMQGKVYAVAIGMCLIGGFLGWLSNVASGNNRFNLKPIILISLGLILILYSYVFIVDTRNGVALTILLFFIWFIWFLWLMHKNGEFKFQSFLGVRYGISGILLAILILFGCLHVKQNPGWNSMIDDFNVAIQIDRYANWQDPSTLGYPKTESGNPPMGNTYERVSWFVAAMSAIPDHLLGDGRLRYAFGNIIKKYHPSSQLTTSHSAWLDFSLSLGLPGVFLLLGSYISIFILSLKSRAVLASAVTWSSLAIIMAYFVTELFEQVAVEWLVYMGGFLSSLLLRWNWPSKPSF